MIILKAIGAFFVKIWHWIKETAWVQPLLIVGAIFSIIFSIPYITKWAKSFSAEGSGQFYKSYDISIEGEKFALGEAVTEADKFSQALLTATKKAYEDTGKTTTAADYKSFTDIYGEKLFLVYYKDSCSACNDAEAGLKYLRDYWDKAAYSLSTNDDKDLPFSLKAINASYVSDNDGEFTVTTGGANAFNRYLYVNSDLFSVAGAKLETTSYKERASISDGYYNQFSLVSVDDSNKNVLGEFPVPSICLIDFTEKAIRAGRAGLCEAAFTVTGDNDISRAKFLLNMWNHTDPYSESNLFTQKD